MQNLVVVGGRELVWEFTDCVPLSSVSGFKMKPLGESLMSSATQCEL